MGGLARQPIQGGRWWWGGYIISSSGFSIFPFLFFLVRRARMMNEGGISLDSGHRDTTPKSDFRCSNQLAQHTHRKVLLVSLYYICIWPLGTIFGGGGWDFFTQKKKKTGIGNERFFFVFWWEKKKKSIIIIIIINRLLLQLLDTLNSSWASSQSVNVWWFDDNHYDFFLILSVSWLDCEY